MRAGALPLRTRQDVMSTELHAKFHQFKHLGTRGPDLTSIGTSQAHRSGAFCMDVGVYLSE